MRVVCACCRAFRQVPLAEKRSAGKRTKERCRVDRTFSGICSAIGSGSGRCCLQRFSAGVFPHPLVGWLARVTWKPKLLLHKRQLHFLARWREAFYPPSKVQRRPRSSTKFICASFTGVRGAEIGHDRVQHCFACFLPFKFNSLYLFRESEVRSMLESEAFSTSFGFSQRCIQEQLGLRVDIILCHSRTSIRIFFAQGRTSRVSRVVGLDSACIICLASVPVVLSPPATLLPSLFLRSLSADTAVVCTRSITISDDHIFESLPQGRKSPYVVCRKSYVPHVVCLHSASFICLASVSASCRSVYARLLSPSFCFFRSLCLVFSCDCFSIAAGLAVHLSEQFPPEGI